MLVSIKAKREHTEIVGSFIMSNVWELTRLKCRKSAKVEHFLKGVAF